MTEWRERAACLGEPVDRFFPEDPNRYRQVVRLCEGCVVKSSCLDEALRVPANVDRYGVYGGLTPPQRRRERDRRATPLETRATPPETPLRWNPSAGRYEAVR